MTVRGVIGLLRPDVGWRMLLDQLGLRVDRVPSSGEIPPESFSVIIVDQPVTDNQAARIEAYLRAGGAVLDTGRFHARLAGAPPRRRHIGSFHPSVHPEVYDGLWLVDIFDNARVPAGERDPILLSTVGRGRLATVGLDIASLALDRRRLRKRFLTEAGPPPNEITSRVSKGEIRHLVERTLRWLHLDRGLPYAHLWYYPDGEESLLAYRIDSDYGDPAAVRELHRVAHEQRARLTWFLHVGAHAEWLEEFARFDGDEIGIHGFRHRTFEGFEENRANILEARALLERAGFAPRGFASPNGFFNEGLAAALHDLGIDYSSEFSADYDNVPSFIPNRAGSITSLQVPVHPISIGSLIRAKYSLDAMKQYYRGAIRHKLAMSEPLFFYHHPLHGRAEVMADTLRSALDEGIRNVTMGEYAEWWRLRGRTRAEVLLSSDGVVTLDVDLPEGVMLAVQGEGRSRAFISAAGAHAMRDLAWCPLRPVVPPPASRISARRPSFRLWRQSLEDLNARSRQ